MAYYYASTQVGAPTLSGTPGALKAVLKTCLVDGFGAMGVTALSVSGGVATVSFAAAHPFMIDGSIRIDGAVTESVNGNHVVSWVSAQQVRFAAPGVPDGAIEGSMTAVVPPAGWVELFGGASANVLVVKSGDVASTGCVLRLDDSGERCARVRSFESMSDIDNGSGPAPMDAQIAGGGWWSKSASADSTARPWLLVADARGFHMFVDPAGLRRYQSMWFGDVASLRSGDAWSCLLTCDTDDRSYNAALSEACNGYSSRSGRDGAYVQRTHVGLNGSARVQRVGAAHNGAAQDVHSGAPGYASGCDAYPNGPNNGLLTCAVEISSGMGIRGTLPGLLHIRNNIAGALGSGVVVDGTNDLSGRRLLAVVVGNSWPYQQPSGTVLLDLTGPWSR